MIQPPAFTQRRPTRQVQVRHVPIGGDAPITVQSMTNIPVLDTEAILQQIDALHRKGCAIVRIAVPDTKSLPAFKTVREATSVPLVADIHFNPELAIGAIECGADKVRINPGNIGSDRGIRKIVDAAKHAGIPIRIGVNSGSLEKHLLQAHGGPTAQALFESARENVSKLEAMGCRDMVVSLKASDVPTTINACRLFSLTMDIPQHIGITESGTVRTGTVRSAVGIGTLLAEGIGDTIRVSLAGDPLDEVVVGRGILTSLGLMAGPTVIACPTCGRTTIDVAGLAHKVEEMVASIDVPIKVAVMGCVVNGPGEARDADVGIAGATDGGSIFVKGECVEKVKPDRMLDALWGAVMRVVEERKTEG